MNAAGDAPSGQPRGELRVVGTSVSREIERLLDQTAEGSGKRAPRILQIGSRVAASDRNERNWRALVAKRFGNHARFVGIDLMEGPNVDQMVDICGAPKAVVGKLGEEPFDLVICSHVLEHTRRPSQAARTIERLLRPGGIAYVATPWSQAFHAAPSGGSSTSR